MTISFRMSTNSLEAETSLKKSFLLYYNMIVLKLLYNFPFYEDISNCLNVMSLCKEKTVHVSTLGKN